MKNILFTALMAMAVFAGKAEAQSADQLYIVPASESGSIEADGNGGYKGQMAMEKDDSDENRFYLNGVNLPSGNFAIYAVSGSTGLSTFYGLVSRAVTPLPVNYPSPLSIARAGRTMSLPAEGIYDFEFFDRDVEGITHHMLVPHPVEVAGDVKYPAQLYLITSSNQYVVLHGDMSTGRYIETVEMPYDFKVSYEPKFDVDAFIFGPSDSGVSTVNLVEGNSVPISYASGTGSVFASADSPKAVSEHTVEVDLNQGFIVIGRPGLTGVDEVAEDISDVDDTTEPQYITLSGIVLSGRPEAAGIYLMRRGNQVTKVAVRE